MVKLCTLDAGGVGSSPGWETKIPHDLCTAKRKKRNFSLDFEVFFLTVFSNMLTSLSSLEDFSHE